MWEKAKCFEFHKISSIRLLICKLRGLNFYEHIKLIWVTKLRGLYYQLLTLIFTVHFVPFPKLVHIYLVCFESLLFCQGPENYDVSCGCQALTTMGYQVINLDHFLKFLLTRFNLAVHLFTPHLFRSRWYDAIATIVQGTCDYTENINKTIGVIPCVLLYFAQQKNACFL